MVRPTILFSTDFSGRCDRARDRAVQLALRWGARLVLLHVLRDPDPETMADERQAEEAAILSRLRKEVTQDNLAVEYRLGFGDVADAVLDVSRECTADFIVTDILRHDEIGDFIIGTTVERIIRHARVPVLVVKERVTQHYGRLMVATDFSDCSGVALRTAIAVFPEAEVTLLHAYHVRLEALRGRERPAEARQAEIAAALDAFLKKVDLPPELHDKLNINVDYGEVCQGCARSREMERYGPCRSRNPWTVPTDNGSAGQHGTSFARLPGLRCAADAPLSRDWRSHSMGIRRRHF